MVQQKLYENSKKYIHTWNLGKVPLEPSVPSTSQYWKIWQCCPRLRCCQREKSVDLCFLLMKMIRRCERKVLRRKGGIVNSVVAIATAKTLTEQSKYEHLKCMDLENIEWARSLFRRMRFVRQAATTGRPKIPDRAIKKAGFLFHHSIIDIADRYQIPASLIMNFDQTRLK